MKIVEALAQLDTGNDLHWTDDGLPSLEAVGSIYGKDVTRLTLTRLAPAFTRSTATDPASKPPVDTPDEPVEEATLEPVDDQVDDTPEDVEKTGDEEPAEQETPNEEPVVAERDPSTFEAVGELDALNIGELTRVTFDRMAGIDAETLATASPADRLRLFDRAVGALLGMRDQLNKVIDAVQADRDLAVADEQTSDTPLHDAVQDYFKSQDRARDEAIATARAASAAFGVQLATAAGGSQLDLAMAKRGGFGTARPTPREPG